MMRRRRKGDTGRSLSTPTLHATPPAVMLMLAVPAGAAADALDDPAPSVRPAAASGTTAGLATGTLRTLPVTSTAERLIVPLDPDAINDSAFLRRLLLSHGIDLDIGRFPAIDADALAAVELAVNGEAAPGIALGNVTGLDATLLIDVHELLSRYPGVDRERTRTRYFSVLPLEPLPDVEEPGEAVPLYGVLADCGLDATTIERLRRRSAGSVTTDAQRANDDEAVARDALLAELWASIERPATRGVTLRAQHVAGVSRRWRTQWQDCGDLSRIAPDILLEPSADAPSEPPDEPVAPVGGGIDANVGSTTDAPRGSESRSGLFLVGDDAPPGFEGLLGPRSLSVDVYLNERARGQHFITVTADEFRFDEPGDVLARLDEVEAPEAIAESLAAPLDTHAALRCYAVGDPPGCGVVETTADKRLVALYDEDRLRVDLFIDPALQSAASLDGARYLAPPPARGSSILSLGAVASRFADDSNGMDVYGRGILGFGAGSLRAAADYSSRAGSRDAMTAGENGAGSETRLRELRYTHYLNDLAFSAGGFPWAPGAGLGNTDLLGARVETSLLTRLDLDAAFSSELTVFLPTRSIVQVVVDERVLSGDSYAAGQQVIDTQALPDGTYEIELRITDAAGVTTVERRVFTKSGAIPPRGQTVFSLTAGRPLSFDTAPGVLPEVGDGYALGVSLARRFSDRSAWRIGLVQANAASYLQGELTYLGPRLSARLTSTAGENAVRTVGLRAATTLGPISTSAFLRSSRSDPAARADALGEQLILPDGDRFGIALSTAIGRTQVGVRAERVREVGPTTIGDERTVTAFARRALFTRRNLRGSLNVEMERRGERDRLGVDIGLSFGRGRSSSRVRTGLERYDGGDIATRLDAATAYDGPDDALVDWRVEARAERRERDTGFGVSGEADHPWFGARAAADWNRSETGELSRVAVASLHSQLGIDGDGFAIGGRDVTGSGVIVDVEGEPAGEAFDIVVNESTVATARIGVPQFVALPPFAAYRIGLRSRGVLDSGLGNGIDEVTLMPGTVQRIARTAERRVLLIGSLVDPTGALVTDALIEIAVNPALIDASGVFQAEVVPGSALEVQLADGRRCRFDVPASDPADGEDEVLILDAPLTCRPAAVATTADQ